MRTFVPGQMVEIHCGPFYEPGKDTAYMRPMKVIELRPGGDVQVQPERGAQVGFPAEWLRVADGAEGVPLEFDPGARLHLTPGQRLALGALFNAGPSGLTDFELADRTGRKQTSIGKRRIELVRMRFVEARLVTRPSDTSTPSRVWAITSLGVDAWHRLHPKERAS